MQLSTLGRTGLKVSKASLGTGGRSRLGRTSGATAEQSANIIRAALDLGVNLIDTAPAYNTEDIVGAALRGRRRDVVLSTKVRINGDERPFDSDDMSGADEIRRSVERSLARLSTDYIDILHLHAIRPRHYQHCLTHVLPELMELRREGKIRFLGITENFGDDPDRTVLRRAISDGVWDVLMLGYNLVNFSATAELLPAAAGKRIGTMCMYAVRGGLANADSARKLIAKLIETGEVDPKQLSGDDPVRFLQTEGAGLTEIAYRFCANAPHIETVMTGTGNVEHLAQNVAAILKPPLPRRMLDDIARVFGNVTRASGDPV